MENHKLRESLRQVRHESLVPNTVKHANEEIESIRLYKWRKLGACSKVRAQKPNFEGHIYFN